MGTNEVPCERQEQLASRRDRWLELLLKSGTATGAVVEGLLKEAREIVRILAASRRTAELRQTARPESSQ